MTPIEKNIIVVDEQGNTLEATYPKRAKGLVKKGRARFISESMICLACPPRKTEENEMSDTKNKFENLEILIDKYVSKHTEEASLKERLMSAIADESFWAAVEIVVEKRKISISFLRRHLSIDFAKASSIIDAMEALDFISAPSMVRPRKLLPKAKEYLACRSN